MKLSSNIYFMDSLFARHIIPFDIGKSQTHSLTFLFLEKVADCVCYCI